MHRLTGVALLLLTAMASGAADEPATQAPEKAAAPEPLDIQKLEGMLGDYEGALYRSDQEKIAADIAAMVKPHAGELVARVKGAEPPVPEVIRLLGFAGTAEAVEVLTGLLDSPDASVRSAAAFSLGNARDKTAVPRLIKLLGDKDVKAANQAAVALGRIGDPRGYEPVLGRLKAKDPLVRLSAIRALGLLADKRAVVQLEEHLRVRDDPLETTAVLDALNRIAGDDLFRIITQLERVAGVLEVHGTGRQTQLAQAAITEALNRFIEEQERRQGQGSGRGRQGQRRQTSSGQRPGSASGSASGRSQGGAQPRADEDAGDAAATDSAFADITRTAAVWGNLPPAVQEEITAALKQELPERYKHLLRIYYKILAEGK